jgi:hypothetical protein
VLAVHDQETTNRRRHEVAKFKDFSREAELEPVTVTLDGDTFTFAGALPTMAVLDMAKVNSVKDVEKLEILMEFLDTVMLPESAARFAERLRSAENPISLDQCMNITFWLIEEAYTVGRPTRGSSPSLNGSETTGTSSTDGAEPTVSTPEPSPL